MLPETIFLFKNSNDLVHRLTKVKSQVYKDLSDNEEAEGPAGLALDWQTLNGVA
jgi:hypothetical protein